MEMDVTEDLGAEDTVVHHVTPTSVLMPESAAELGRRLLLAARLGDTELVLQLMARGAPFTTDWLGTSALHVAAGAGHAATCAVLLRAGVSRDCRTKVERTPLHLAAHAGHAAVAALLLRARAAPHCRDMLHMTPLHWAAARGHAAVARALLQHGADPRALSKFGKSPLSIAAQKGHRDVLALLEEALAEREAAESVESLREAETESPAAPRPLDPPDGLQDAARPPIDRSPRAEPVEIDVDIERPPETQGAAMLRRHGIALLPRDEGSTVLSALQSGRSVVLSDAGKLMLKESSEIPPVESAPPPTTNKGVVLTATPVKSPPKQGVKIFTLNNKMLAMPKENKAPVKKVIDPHDSVQIQYIKLSSDAKITTTKSIPMKAKNKMPSPAPATVVLPRPTVKLMMQKANLSKLLAPSENGSETSDSKGRSDERNVLFVPEEFLTNSSPKYLRAQLLTAHKTIASLNAELEKYKTRLSKYENV